jgi:hypothetical protein
MWVDYTGRERRVRCRRQVMKTLWTLSVLFLCLSCCVEHRTKDVESYTCTAEQQEQVKSMTKACKEKLATEAYINDCFKISVTAVCHMKARRCPEDKDDE